MNSKLKILFFCIWSISSFAMQEESVATQEEIENFLQREHRLQQISREPISAEKFERFLELLESSNIDPLVFSKADPNLSIFALAIKYKQERCAIAMLNAILSRNYMLNSISRYYTLNATSRKNHKQIISKNKDSSIYLGLLP
ncbi:MAG: hypothetical protein K2X39_09675, partial [Silvanigrellaceae bacterium]|nr:hypothetical protein [Silvanigrellaceae bacterium]